jgi:hypothetical protein
MFTVFKALWGVRRIKQNYSYNSKCQKIIIEVSFFVDEEKLSPINCGEWSMKSLWDLDLSRAMPNKLQAEFGTVPAAEEGEGKM